MFGQCLFWFWPVVPLVFSQRCWNCSRGALWLQLEIAYKERVQTILLYRVLGAFTALYWLTVVANLPSKAIKILRAAWPTRNAIFKSMHRSELSFRRMKTERSPPREHFCSRLEMSSSSIIRSHFCTAQAAQIFWTWRGY